MAEQEFRLNLGAAAFPMLSDWMGRSVVVPNLDESGDRTARDVNQEPMAKESSVPQIYYCHNVMPVGQGFKSLAYKRIIKPPIVVDPPVDFEKMIPIKDPDETKGFMGFTSTGRIFMINAGDSVWTEVTSQLTTVWPGGETSYAYANGFTYLCLRFNQVYKLNVQAKTFAPAVLSGITNSLIKNITSSSNYLILTDDVTVYWSSASNPEDFVPSLATGSGSGTPQDLNGQIVAALPLSAGFAVYTTANIIIASYSGNIRYPWIFKQAPNSGGITSIEHVAFDSDGGSNYAWTSSGLLRVAPTGCVPQHPEITDFLAGRVFEDYDDATDVLSQQYLTTDLRIKIIFIGSRFLIISYGILELTHALLYDSALRRWGKAKINHADVFEVILFAEEPLSWNQLYPNGWDTFAGIAWQDLTTLSNFAASAKRTIGFLQKDGSVQLAVWDYGNFSANAVMMIGKYQLTRSKMTSFQEVQVETIDPNNPMFSVLVSTSLDGKKQSYLNTLTQHPFDDPTSANRRYNKLVTGANHTVICKGAFALVSMQVIVCSEGWR